MAEDATLGMAVLLFVGGTTALLMRQCAERIEQDRHFSTPWARIAFTLAVVVGGAAIINLVGGTWLHATRGSLIVLSGMWVLVGFVFLFAKVAHVFRPR